MEQDRRTARRIAEHVDALCRFEVKEAEAEELAKGSEEWAEALARFRYDPNAIEGGAR